VVAGQHEAAGHRFARPGVLLVHDEVAQVDLRAPPREQDVAVGVELRARAVKGDADVAWVGAGGDDEVVFELALGAVVNPPIFADRGFSR